MYWAKRQHIWNMVLLLTQINDLTLVSWSGMPLTHITVTRARCFWGCSWLRLCEDDNRFVRKILYILYRKTLKIFNHIQYTNFLFISFTTQHCLSFIEVLLINVCHLVSSDSSLHWICRSRSLWDVSELVKTGSVFGARISLHVWRGARVGRSSCLDPADL